MNKLSVPAETFASLSGWNCDIIKDDSNICMSGSLNTIKLITVAYTSCEYMYGIGDFKKHQICAQMMEKESIDWVISLKNLSNSV